MSTVIATAGKIFRENAGASIIDTGDRVAMVEFHTKANALSDDIVDMLKAAIKEGVGKFDAIVIGNHGRHFSAGANLQWLLGSARDRQWNAVERTMSNLQETNMLIKYGPMPVVAAPFSYALGGGCEIVLHSSRVVAAANLHLGLVETGVGLIPAGGGTKELMVRALGAFADKNDADLLSGLRKVFNLIRSARVSTDGAEAKELFLTPTDIITTEKESPIEMAKEVALGLVAAGYRKAQPEPAIPVSGSGGIRLFRDQMAQLVDSATMTAHDGAIALHLATILCGGDIPAGPVSEQELLDLEREAFLSLLGTEKTQERIAFMLENNKPLHN